MVSYFLFVVRDSDFFFFFSCLDTTGESTKWPWRSYGEVLAFSEKVIVWDRAGAEGLMLQGNF